MTGTILQIRLGTMRLNKFLAHSGVASRRKCDDLIKMGQVKVNGEQTYNFGQRIQDDDCVTLNGQIINPIKERIGYLFHKPKGVLSTVTDDRKRKTVMDFFDVDVRLFPVGRLDRDTTGVLLVTNDGDLANHLTHPKYEVEKIYIAVTDKDVPKADYTNVKKGIRLDDGKLARAVITRLEKLNKKYYWKIVLTEGKKREVKRIFAELGCKTLQLHRESFADIRLGNLKPGKYRRLKKIEVEKLLNVGK